MSPRTWQQRIQDILTCARNIESFTENMTFESFVNDPRSIRAVAFEFIILGEAARAVPVDIQKRSPNIPWPKMQGIRNILVHEYFRVDEEILWTAAKEDIPSLIEALEGLLE